MTVYIKKLNLKREDSNSAGECVRILEGQLTRRVQLKNKIQARFWVPGKADSSNETQV